MINSHIQAAHQSPSRINTKEKHINRIQTKLLKTIYKEKILGMCRKILYTKRDTLHMEERR